MFTSWIPSVVSVGGVTVVIVLRWMLLDMLLDSFGAPPGAGGWPPPRKLDHAATSR